MKLSEKIRKSMDDAEAGLAISWPIDQWADEVAKLEARLEDEEGLKMQAVQEWNRVEAENATLKREMRKIYDSGQGMDNSMFDVHYYAEFAYFTARDALLADTQEPE